MIGIDDYSIHGSIYDKPSSIVEAYKDWISDKPKNLVVLPYISMHGSTKKWYNTLQPRSLKGELIPDLKVDLIEPVLCKGDPRQETLVALDNLADEIAHKHKEAGLLA